MKTSEKLEAAREKLAVALREGEDTAAIRKEIKTLETKLATEEKAQADRDRKAKEARTAAVEGAAEKITKGEHEAASDAAHVNGLEQLLPGGEEMVGVENDPDLEAAAQEVAQAQVAFDEARSRYQAAHHEAEKLQQRLQEKQAREHELKQARLSGDEDNAAELHALALDIEGLSELLAAARREADQISPAHEQRALKEAQERLAKVRARLTARVLEQRARQAEQVLIRAHKQLIDAAMAAGEANRFTVFKPTQELKFICFGTV